MRGVLDRHIDYSMLHDVQQTGPSVGLYAGREIAASVIDAFGRRFVYAGIAPRKSNGVFDVDALGPGEFIVQPGLVYRLDARRSAPWWHALLGSVGGATAFDKESHSR